MEPKDLKEIKAIIDLMKKNDLLVFEIEKEGFRLKLQRGGSSQAAQPGTLSTPVGPKAAAAGPFNKTIYVKVAGVDAPMEIRITGEVLTADAYTKYEASKGSKTGGK